jgi:hypothetical protein
VCRIWGIPRLKPLVRPCTRRGYFRCKPWCKSSSTQASLLYGVRGLCLLCSRAALGPMIDPSTARATVPVRVTCGLASPWDLPIKAEGEAVCCDQLPLLVLPCGTRGAVPELGLLAFCEGMFVETEANSADSPTWACAGLKKLLLGAPRALPHTFLWVVGR